MKTNVNKATDSGEKQHLLIPNAPQWSEGAEERRNEKIIKHF